MIKFTEEEKREIVGRIISMLSRKFIMSLLIFAVSTYLVSRGVLSAERWLVIVAGDILGYQFSNAYSKGRTEGGKYEDR